jgi:hypothetical protein
MPDRSAQLGGRPPLLDPETLAAEQRHLYDPIEATMAAWSDRVCFKNDTAEN